MNGPEIINVPEAGGAKSAARAFQAFQYALFIPLRLQTSQEPCARIGQALVIQIHRVLRG